MRLAFAFALGNNSARRKKLVRARLSRLCQDVSTAKNSLSPLCPGICSRDGVVPPHTSAQNRKSAYSLQGPRLSCNRNRNRTLHSLSEQVAAVFINAANRTLSSDKRLPHSRPSNRALPSSRGTPRAHRRCTTRTRFASRCL